MRAALSLKMEMWRSCTPGVNRVIDASVSVRYRRRFYPPSPSAAHRPSLHVDDQLLPVIKFSLPYGASAKIRKSAISTSGGINNVALLLSTPAVMDLSALFRLRHQQRHAESSLVR